MSIMNKQCRACKKYLPVSFFFKNGKYIRSICKNCCIEYNKKYREKNREKINEYKRNCRKNDKGKGYEYKIKYYKNNREKVLAHKKVARAIWTGKLQRLPCEICRNVKAQGHHEDYSKPLIVRWLCQSHHQEAHSKV